MERLFAKTDAFDDAMAFFSAGKFLYANAAFLDLFGYDDLAQLVGRSIDSVTAPDAPYTDYAERMQATPAENGSGYRFDWMHRKTDGTTFASEVIVFPVGLDEESLYAVIVVDLSDWIQRAESMSDFYGEFYGGKGAIILIIDPEDGRILYASEGACAFYGYTEEEITGRPIDAINTLSRTEVRAEMDKAVSQKRRHFEFYHRLADGTVREVRVISGPIDYMGKRALYSLVRPREIEQKASVPVESALYEQVFFKGPEAQCVVATDDRVLVASEAFYRFFRYEPGEVVGRSIMELVISTEYREEARRYRDLLAFGESLERDVIRRDHLGNDHLCHMILTPLRWGEELVGTHVIYRDRGDEAEESERQLLERCFTRTEEGFAIADSEGIIQWSNRPFQRNVWGVGRREPMAFGSLLLEEDRKKARAVLETEGRWRGEARPLVGGGPDTSLWVRIYRIENNEGETSLYVILLSGASAQPNWEGEVRENILPGEEQRT